MEEVGMDVKGSKLLQKFVKVCKRIVRSNARSRYCRLDTAAEPPCTRSDSKRRHLQASDSSCSCSDSNRRPLRTLSLPVAPDHFHGHDSDANPNISDNCFNLMADCKWHIRRRLSCRLSFVQRKEGNKVRNNNNHNSCPPKDVPKGFIAVYVGDMQEEQMRFVIPVFYLNHPLFLHLLKETEQVYGFSQKGVFTIPCQVSDFEYLQWLIEREENRN